MSEVNLETFGAWLCAREQEEVGRPGTFFHAPLALWLSDLFGGSYGVDGSVFGPVNVDSCHWRPLPRWAELFVARSEQHFCRVMSGADAFVVLAHVEQLLPAAMR